jgi:hypothetical protein
VTPDEFERAFIARCEALAQERGLSQSELARRVWPSKGDPIKHWRTLRNQGSRLPMVDAFHLAGALEVDFSALCWGAAAAINRDSWICPQPRGRHGSCQSRGMKYGTLPGYQSRLRCGRL